MVESESDTTESTKAPHVGMAAVSDESMLLERVFLRIGSAESDEQLEKSVCKFLPPVLLKLDSQQDGIRKRVMELLVHINKRLKSRPLVQLPVDALLTQYQQPSASSFLRNFTIIYIKMGYPRLPVEKQAELIPVLLSAMTEPSPHQDSLFLLIMPVLRHVKVPADAEQRKAMFKLSEKPRLAKQFADFLLDVLLLPYGCLLKPSGTQDQQPPPRDEQNEESVSAASTVPPGLSEHALKRLLSETPMKPEELEQNKVGIVTFLSSGVYPESEILCQLVVASADSRFSVANAADFELRKITGSLDWSNASMMSPLFLLYLGTPQVNNSSKTTAPAVKAEFRRTPASTRLRLKLLPCLVKARGQALVFPLCIQVFFDSLYGNNTNLRLKGLALTFCLSIIRNVSPSLLSHVTHVLLSGLLKFLNEGEPTLKGQTYNVIGHLAIQYPGLINSDLVLLTKFFEALGTEEGQDLRLNIREALLTMVDAFRPESAQNTAHVPPCKANGSTNANKSGAPGTSKETNSSNGKSMELIHLQMQELLMKQIQNPEPMVRFVVVIYAAKVFPPNHASSRYLLLMASADSKDEVATEALASLYQTSSSLYQGRKGEVKETKEEKNELPPFPEMVEYISTQVQTTKGGAVKAFTPQTFVQVIRYLRLCLARSAGVVLPVNEVLMHPSDHTPKIGRYLQESNEKHPDVWGQYLNLVNSLLTIKQDTVALLAMLEAVGCLPKSLAPRFIDRLLFVKNLLCHSREEIRELSAQLFAVFCVYGLECQSKMEAQVMELCTDAVKPKAVLEAQHGLLLAMSHTIERFIMFNRARGSEDVNDLLSWNLFKKVVHTLVSFLDNPSPILVGAATTGIGILGRSSGLPLMNGKSDTPDDFGKLDVLLKLQQIMKNVKLPSKVKERAGKATGFLCIGETFPHVREVMEDFLKVARETRDVEVHLSVGEALVCCVLGPASPESRDPWVTLAEEFKPPSYVGNPADSAESLWLYNKLLNEMAKDTHPNVRQACCLWLLALLKNCGDAKSIKSSLSKIQTVFMEFLGENNDIVQDAASKGLGLVYDSSGPEEKEKLVADLLETLMSGRRAVAQVTPDSQIFEEGEIGKAPGGNNLSTYRELCSLASDLNQPDLIYKFMHLANHNAVWNSKKGAAFGFSSIATLAGDQLSQHLPKIVPRLYRYRFDPSPKIQNSMASIWHSLVPETSKTVDKYHKEILEDLIQNLTAGQWRVRQSCCLAICDFIRGSSSRSIQDDMESLPLLWSQLFRVMDDVHDATRQAAGNTARALSKLCVRACDASQGKSGQEMVKTILPVLLESGISNKVTEIRSLSLQTVSQLVNVAGPQLKPHLPLLLPALLEATGENETVTLAYISTYYGAQADKQEDIDNARASAARSHYTTETMTKCLPFIDAEILEQIMPRLLDILLRSIALGTRVAATHFVKLLSHNLKNELKPFAGKLMSALLNGLKDRNPVVRKCYASAIGHVVGSAKDTTLKKLFEKLRLWYFEKQDEGIHTAVGHTLYAISQHNQDVLNNYMDMMVPFVFFAMHAKKTPETTAAVEVWENIWSEAVPSAAGALRTHIEEVCNLLNMALQSSSWTVKAQAANAVGSLSNKVGNDLKPKQLSELLNALLAGLGGRIWEGKHCLMQALAVLCSNFKETLLKAENRDMFEKIVKAGLGECGKSQLEYKLNTILSLATIINVLQAECIDSFLMIIKPYLESNESKTDEDLDSAENSRQQELWLKLRVASFEALGKVWPTDYKAQAKFQEEFLLPCVTALTNSPITVQVAIISAVSSIVDRHCLLDASNEASKSQASKQEVFKLIGNIEKSLDYALGIGHSVRIRKDSLNILLSLVKKLKECGHQEMVLTLSASFSPILEDLSKISSPEVKSRALDLKELLKTC